MVLAPSTSSTLSACRATTRCPPDDQQGGDVGQVELAVGVVGGEQVELAEECRGLEAVDAGVDLACGKLGWREGFLLDDGDDLGLAGCEAQDAAVAGGILGERR